VASHRRVGTSSQRTGRQEINGLPYLASSPFPLLPGRWRGRHTLIERCQEHSEMRCTWRPPSTGLWAAGQHRPDQLHDHVAALDEAIDIVQGLFRSDQRYRASEEAIITASAPRSPARARSRSRSQAPDKYPRPYWRPSEGGSLVRYLRISGQRWGYHFYV